jgi:antitoxin MazE
MYWSTSSVARSVGFKVGQPVEVSARDPAVVVSAAVAPRLTLKQKLILFDPERHGGEAMAKVRSGREAPCSREAEPHPWKQIPSDAFTRSCETMNQIIAIG